ncbi:unnamed protein product [Schistocephalus solidus]|uniref:Uncharacterized protein n=1 Tax=Schistocephalus solidus TaxID=70667 RepID=A0A183TGM0_SCHSO|nr:unnamed protein product [Schistocephalus solidus]
MHMRISGCLSLDNPGCPHRPIILKAESHVTALDALCDLTDEHKFADVADTAAGRVLFWQPTISNPFCDSSEQKKTILPSGVPLPISFCRTGPEGRGGQGLPYQLSLLRYW